jgi:hypothetical protein
MIVPRPAAMKVTKAATISAVRAPARMRLKKSRPISSVPNQKSPLGPSAIRSRSWYRGSCGVSSSPTAASTTKSSTMPPPRTAIRLASKRFSAARQGAGWRRIGIGCPAAMVVRALIMVPREPDSVMTLQDVLHAVSHERACSSPLELHR